MKNLSGAFNSSFMRQKTPARKTVVKTGSAGQQKAQQQAASRHFAMAPPAPKPAGGMPNFKPLFTAHPAAAPLAKTAAELSADDLTADAKLRAR